MGASWIRRLHDAERDRDALVGCLRDVDRALADPYIQRDELRATIRRAVAAVRTGDPMPTILPRRWG